MLQVLLACPPALRPTVFSHQIYFTAIVASHIAIYPIYTVFIFSDDCLAACMTQCIQVMLAFLWKIGLHYIRIMGAIFLLKMEETTLTSVLPFCNM